MDPYRTPPSRRRQGSLHARGALSALAVIAILVTACAGARTGPATAPGTSPAPTLAAPSMAVPSPSPSLVVESTPAATLVPPSPAPFPLTLSDDEGRPVTIPAEPQRIVSLTPATTEIVFALGAGDRLVAGTDFDDFPAEAIALPDVASFTSVDVEQIVALEADLVLAGGNSFNPPAALEQLRRLGVPVLVVYAETVDHVLADIRLIGTAIGRPAQANGIVDAMQVDIEQVRQAVTGLPRPRVFYELDAFQEIFGPADDSFIAEMVELAGGRAITTGSRTVFSIALERLVEADPEVIVLGDAAYGVTPAQVVARPGWGTMTAVRVCAIRPVDDLLVTRPGPRLAEGLRLLALAIHPDAVVPGPAPTPRPSPGSSPPTVAGGC